MAFLFCCFRRIFWRRIIDFTLLMIGLGCCGLSLFHLLPLRLNFTASMPRGVYWITHSQPKVGDWVAVCLPNTLAQFGLKRGYLHAGSCLNQVEPLFKQVVGIAGNTVVLGSHGVWINGVLLPHSATLPVDTLYRPLPAVPRGIYVLNPQQVWLFGIGSDKSWDSRYFGTVDRSAIQGVVKPLFIFNGSESK